VADGISIDVDELLDVAPKEQLGVGIPLPLNRRILALRPLLRRAGAGRVRKDQIVSALLADAIRHADADGPDALVAVLAAYDRLSVNEILDAPDPLAKSVTYQRLSRGRTRNADL
jgi:hypothetical protein